MANIIDSYSETNRDTFTIIGWQDNLSIAVGQAFTGNGANLGSCQWYLQKNNSPTGNMVAKLYAITGTFGTNAKPTGSALATSATIDASTLPASFGLVTFTFDGTYAPANGTNYVISLEYSSGNGTDNILVGADSSSPSHAGNWSSYFTSWNGANDYDLPFYVYDTAGAATTSTSSTSSSISTSSTSSSVSTSSTSTSRSISTSSTSTSRSTSTSSTSSSISTSSTSTSQSTSTSSTSSSVSTSSTSVSLSTSTSSTSSSISTSSTSTSLSTSSTSSSTSRSTSTSSTSTSASTSMTTSISTSSTSTSLSTSTSSTSFSTSTSVSTSSTSSSTSTSVSITTSTSSTSSSTSSTSTSTTLPAVNINIPSGFIQHHALTVSPLEIQTTLVDDTVALVDDVTALSGGQAAIYPGIRSNARVLRTYTNVRKRR